MQSHSREWPVTHAITWDGCTNHQRLPKLFKNDGDGGLFEVWTYCRNVIGIWQRDFKFLGLISLFKIYIRLKFLNFLCIFTYFLNYSATLRLFLRRSLHRCLVADHERSSISRSFLCNRERLLFYERRETRCVKIMSFWSQYVKSPQIHFNRDWYII